MADAPSPAEPAPPEVEPGAARAASNAPLTAGQVARRLGPAGPLAVVSAVMPAVAGIVLLANIKAAGNWVAASGVFSYAAAFAILAGLALLPTYAQAVVGGWAFGFATGFPAALLGFVGGALIGYELGLRASGDRVLRLLEERPKWKTVVDSLVHGGFWRTLTIVTLLRLPPNSPFAITNLVLSSTKVARLPYLLGTLIGMAPRTAWAVSIGASARAAFGSELTGDAVADAKKKIFFVGILATVAVLLVIGQLAKKALERVSQRRPDTGAGL
jgi:uncharacterized membrane protein YdjX (TVP38/TMEM64 family)